MVDVIVAIPVKKLLVFHNMQVFVIVAIAGKT